MKDKTIVFDLDDTLIKEIHYLKSAYKEIAYYVDKKNVNLYNQMLDLYFQGENVFQYLVSKYKKVCIADLLKYYRNHQPKLELNEGALDILKWCRSQNYTMGLITDGRSIQQNNKLDAVKIKPFFDKIIISEEFGFEKPSLEGYKEFERFKGQKYYIADNTFKDFLSPNMLNWISICLLDDGQNIHKQSFDLAKEYLPHYKVNSLKDIPSILLS